MNDAPNYEAVLADIDARIARLQAARESVVAFMLSQGWHSPLNPQNPQNQPAGKPRKPA